ncbi:FG-GAP repeat domain-containing protein [Occallatibacter savannae]|uniref:FG-GAP repeat domain-containing protein n=1 Tax=Occallatibacter savannae TaxID=1002691 RepID=UPI0013A5AAC4|nr:VCBS repeat-containing protein [Occallatibacter savannae]
MRVVSLATVLITTAISASGLAQAPIFGHRSYTSTYAYAHADLNNDGREDLVYHTQTGFAVALSTADATYAAPVNYNVPDNAGSGTVVLDINNDGKPDVIAFNSFAPGFYEYLNTGSGGLHLQATYLLGDIEDMVVGDFNHDGFPDLAIATPGYLRIWFNNHASGFTLGPTTVVPGSNQLSVGDFDGDGKADIAVTSTGNTYLYFGDNTGHFQIVNATTAHHPQVYLMDIDGDGKSDLVGVGVASGGYMTDTFYRAVWVIYGNSSRSISENEIPTHGYTVAWTWGSIPDKSPSVDVGDFNGDGKQDFAVVEAQNSDGGGTRTLAVLTGNGNRTWNNEINVYSNSELDFGVATIRANRDSKPDLMVDTFANNAQTGQFFVNDTSGGYYGGCSLPNASTGIHVCSATTYASTSVRISASAAGQTITRKLEVWVDGAKKYEQLAKHDFSHSGFLDATLALSAGKHTITIVAAGYDNLLLKKSYAITVQ